MNKIDWTYVLLQVLKLGQKLFLKMYKFYKVFNKNISISH